MRKTTTLLAGEKLTNFALFVSISIVLSIFEMLLPINFIVPGVKLGLGNIMLVVVLRKYKFWELFVFQLLKISITTFVLGLFSVYLYSLCGGMFALVVMYGCCQVFKEKISVYTISMYGAIAHNLGQIIFAIFTLHSIELVYYIPFLIIFGTITGFALGHVITLVEPFIWGDEYVGN